MNNSSANLENLVNQPYKYGFSTQIETDSIKKGLTRDTVKLISEKKTEPPFMLEFRLKAFEKWLKMDEPDWAFINYEKADYQAI